MSDQRDKLIRLMKLALLQNCTQPLAVVDTIDEDWRQHALALGQQCPGAKLIRHRDQRETAVDVDVIRK